MPEEKLATDAGAEAPKEVVVDAVVTPAVVEPPKEEIVDEDLQEFGVPPMPKPEDFKEEEKDVVTPEKPVVPEAKVEAKPDAAVVPPVAPLIPQKEASSIDKRIAKLYQETQVLQGKEAPDTEAIIASIKGGTFAEKEAALHRLLADRKTLRGGADDGKAEMSDEDREALIDARAEEKFQAMQGEIAQKEWNDDLVKTVDAHPELNETLKEYNPRIAGAVEKLVQRGMKCSEAYALVTESVAVAQAKEEKAVVDSAEIKKQKALSGAVGASNDFSKKGKEMTWIEFDALRTEDPAKYEKLLDEGFKPSDDE